MLIQLGCCADLRQRVESVTSDLDGEYLMEIDDAKTLCSLEKPADVALRMPHLKKVFSKLQRIQERRGVETTQYNTIHAAAAAIALVKKELQSVTTPHQAPNLALLLSIPTSTLLVLLCYSPFLHLLS